MSDSKQAVKDTIRVFLDSPGGERLLNYLQEGSELLIASASHSKDPNEIALKVHRSSERKKIKIWLEAFMQE